MVLPLYLAMMDTEIQDHPSLPSHIARMGCTFAPEGPGLCDLPETLPKGGILMVDDRNPMGSHDPDVVATMLADTADRPGIDCILLDFERPPTAVSQALAARLAKSLPCPVGMPPDYGATLDCPLFLPPCPLYMPVAEYLHPWKNREIWMEARMLQQTITVTPQGTVYSSPTPTDNLTGGYYDEILCCQCITEISDQLVQFILYDTPETLQQKWKHPNITRTIGLYQDWNET